ncbi:UDP-glycosyltransferase 74F2 [Camellia lanceoleosa]|uniref:UDP-glycosyltransferase 74F2 n=1 Tax=Camellia lanceoleosa TaxID=1840588 RepID=A0ACC0HEE4_9ERIC|nr:UDP-glycosyltransferase 74F2 [Camellia lanceoleosa]
MEKRKKSYSTHVLAIPYLSQGHINPLLQLCKRLVSKGLKATFAITIFISNSIHHHHHPPQSNSSLQFDTISDGCDQAGFPQAGSVQDYLARLEAAGSQTLAELIRKYGSSDNSIDCIIYDAYLPWALDVAKQFGLAGATFFTQPCAVDYIYYYVHHGLLKLPVESSPVSIPGLPLLELQDMPSFIYVHGSYPAYFELVLNQFSNVDKADYVLVNTFYQLEAQVVDSMSKLVSPLMTIGPTIPSSYLDNQLENDNDYGFDLYYLDPSACTNWLSTKPKGSVVYVSFGSMADLGEEQMEELAWGLLESNFYFLWVVRDSEKEKLPTKFKQETLGKGLLVGWCS